MYKPKNVPEIVAAKTADFWSKLGRSNSETVDNYYNRFHELLDEINDFRETVPKQDAIRHFLFTLGSDFESIQNSYRIDNLPSSWKTDDWPTLLILCRDYYNSLHPTGPPSKKDSTPGDHIFASKQERVAHQKKIRLWFMNPVKFKKELDTEQKKYVGKCVYHLCDNHPTSSCNVKRECEKLIADNVSTSQVSSSTGQLRHISEETFEDAVELRSSEADLDEFANDTNEESLHYFACITNHYLCLVRSSNKMNPRHQMRYPIIADSGANYHMLKDPEFFE